jgi:two-component system response regulator
MNERDVRLLFNANHWSGATVRFAPEENGWLVEFNTPNDTETEVLTLKRGNPRIFKTSDTALLWCRDMGFTKIFVQLHKMLSQEDDGNSFAAKILLVEDDSGDIDLTLRAIQGIDSQFDIIVCRDGLEALDFLFAEGKYSSRDVSELPQLILLDLNLPKMNGHEVLRTIRNNKITQYIPVVILSSSDEGMDITRGYELGNNSYVRKPVDYSEFCDTIKKIGQYWLDTNLLPIAH